MTTLQIDSNPAQALWPPAPSRMQMVQSARSRLITTPPVSVSHLMTGLDGQPSFVVSNYSARNTSGASGRAYTHQGISTGPLQGSASAGDASAGSALSAAAAAAAARSRSVPRPSSASQLYALDGSGGVYDPGGAGDDAANTRDVTTVRLAYEGHEGHRPLSRPSSARSVGSCSSLDRHQGPLTADPPMDPTLTSQHVNMAAYLQRQHATSAAFKGSGLSRQAVISTPGQKSSTSARVLGGLSSAVHVRPELQSLLGGATPSVVGRKVLSIQGQKMNRDHRD